MIDWPEYKPSVIPSLFDVKPMSEEKKATPPEKPTAAHFCWKFCVPGDRYKCREQQLYHPDGKPCECDCHEPGFVYGESLHSDGSRSFEQ